MAKKNNNFFLILVAFVLLIIIGCKDFGVPNYNFIVILGEGVGGQPDAGSYIYKELSSVDYEYVYTDDTEKHPNVFINDAPQSLTASGSIIMYRDVEIYVGIVNIRGNWRLTFTDGNGNEKESTIQFSGNTNLEGTFTDSRGYEGTWKNSENDLLMIFTNLDNQTYEGKISPKYLSGNAFSGDTVSGSWNMIRD